MAMEYLGETFDIHTGGVDLQFPHHENEIAQSESATGKPFARFWVHAEHLLVDGKKMSKSDGNFYTLRDLLDRGHSPDAIRYMLVATPYRKQLNFTFDGLRAAAASIERLRNFARRLEDGYRLPDGEEASAAAARARVQFQDSLDDDLNTAGALGAVFEYVRAANSAMDSGTFGPGNASEGLAVLGEFDRIFDVMRPPSVARIARGEIERLVEERAAARRARNFALADRIRDGLASRGVVLRDGPSGTQWHYSE